MNYDAVLFDMDGVLIEGAATPAKVYRRAADDAIDALGLDIPESQRDALHKLHYDEEMAARCRELGVDPAEFWQTREQHASERANSRLADGARPAFSDTAAIGALPVPTGVVSNNRHATVEFVAEDLLDARFDVVVGRDPTVEGFHRRKPESHYLDHALATLDVERALYVGDRPSDVTTARRAGIDGGFVRREHNSAISFDDPPAVDVASLDELAELFDRA